MVVAGLTLLLLVVLGFRIAKKQFGFDQKLDQILLISVIVGAVLSNAGIIAITEKLLKVAFNVLLVLFIVWGGYQLYLLWKKKKKPTEEIELAETVNKETIKEVTSTWDNQVENKK